MIAAAGLMIAGSAMAVDMPAEAAPCKACHSIEKKMVGPAWKDVAKKYAGDAEAASKIAANITKGGKFGWNIGVMPPKGMAKSEADIKKLAEFIAGLK
jgi:cytochrome c